MTVKNKQEKASTYCLFHELVVYIGGGVLSQKPYIVEFFLEVSLLCRTNPPEPSWHPHPESQGLKL